MLSRQLIYKLLLLNKTNKQYKWTKTTTKTTTEKNNQKTYNNKKNMIVGDTDYLNIFEYL